MSKEFVIYAGDLRHMYIISLVVHVARQATGIG